MSKRAQQMTSNTARRSVPGFFLVLGVACLVAANCCNCGSAAASPTRSGPVPDHGRAGWPDRRGGYRDAVPPGSACRSLCAAASWG